MIYLKIDVVPLVYAFLILLIAHMIGILITIRVEANEGPRNIDYLVDKNEPRLKPLPRKIRKKIMRWLIEKFYLPKHPSK